MKRQKAGCTGHCYKGSMRRSGAQTCARTFLSCARVRPTALSSRCGSAATGAAVGRRKGWLSSSCTRLEIHHMCGRPLGCRHHALIYACAHHASPRPAKFCKRTSADVCTDHHMPARAGALCPRLHGDARARVAVQAAADDVGERGVAQRRHVDRVGRVGDGVHLLDEGAAPRRACGRTPSGTGCSPGSTRRWALPTCASHGLAC